VEQNPKATDLLQSVKGKRINQFPLAPFAPSTKDRPTPTLAQALTMLQQSHESYRDVYLSLTAASQPVHFECRITPIRSDQQNIRAFVLCLRDITEKHTQDQRIRELSSLLIQAQERERKSLARELHDGVGQTILAAKMHLESLGQEQPDPSPKFDTGIRYLRTASDEIRHIHNLLFPSTLRELGLEAAIKWHSANYLEKAGINCQINLSALPEWDTDQSIHIYRLIQEASTNIVKHARATQVCIYTQEDKSTGEVALHISDNGIGLGESATQPHTGSGLFNMEQRARECDAGLQILSPPEGGTDIVLRYQPKQN
jgi:two-component system NarL family sensor kinase